MNHIETPKEAIDFFEYKLDDWLWMANQQPAEAAKIAILALEKQIPKKPIESEFDPLICSDCEAKVILGQKYCINCGQKIDWSDEE